MRSIRLVPDVTGDLDDALLVSGFDGGKAVMDRSPYGWTVHEGDYSEWQFDIRYVGRHDGLVDWMVILTEVDGEVRTLHGRHKLDEFRTSIHESIFELTVHWIHPINKEA